MTGTEAGTEHLAGPVVGTWLFTVGKAIPFFADAVAMVLSSFPLARFRSKSAPAEGSSTSAWEGARLLFADHRLRILLLMVASLAGLQGMEAGILVLLATTEWGVRRAHTGSSSPPARRGTSWEAWRPTTGPALRQRPCPYRAALVSGVGYLVMAVAHGWQLAGPAFALVGFAVGAGSVVANSLRQRLTPTSLMGRVGGAWRGLVWGAAPVGALAAGSLACDRRAPSARWCWPGRCSAPSRCSWPGPSSAASARAPPNGLTGGPRPARQSPVSRARRAPREGASRQTGDDPSRIPA